MNGGGLKQRLQILFNTAEVEQAVFCALAELVHGTMKKMTTLTNVTKPAKLFGQTQLYWHKILIADVYSVS